MHEKGPFNTDKTKAIIFGSDCIINQRQGLNLPGVDVHDGISVPFIDFVPLKRSGGSLHFCIFAISHLNYCSVMCTLMCQGSSRLDFRLRLHNACVRCIRGAGLMAQPLGSPLLPRLGCLDTKERKAYFAAVLVYKAYCA